MELFGAAWDLGESEKLFDEMTHTAWALWSTAEKKPVINTVKAVFNDHPIGYNGTVVSQHMCSLVLGWLELQ